LLRLASLEDLTDRELEGFAMADRSTIYFPLRSNAAALFAGPGVAGVRRRVLAAALLNDEVVLEDGLYVAWAGSGGASTMMAHGNQPERWQTPHQRGRLTGTTHHFAVRATGAPETDPFHPLVTTEAAFSWQATFEPFRRELPASAAGWLSFGHMTDEEPAKEIVQGWESADHNEELRRYGRNPVPEPADGQFVHSSILKAGYFDLAVAATSGFSVSFDRRHRLAVERRCRAGDAHVLGGHYALEVLLPTEFTWTDVPDLRKHRALREYRAIIREVEEQALRSGRSVAEIDERIHGEYEARLAAATARDIPFAGRAALSTVGFVLGAAADTAAPVVGGAAVTAAAFVVGEAVSRAIRPRWLAIDRRLRGTRNGL
jgi:hypothetical protein